MIFRKCVSVSGRLSLCDTCCLLEVDGRGSVLVSIATQKTVSRGLVQKMAISLLWRLRTFEDGFKPKSNPKSVVSM